MKETVLDIVTTISKEEFEVSLLEADAFTDEVTETEVIEETEENND